MAQLEMNLDGEMMEADENAEYNAFVEKFKPKKTTDDCYTPQNIYDAVAGWVESEYGVDRSNFVRPFYPGGDYERFTYPQSCVVVDNPPFSILSQIVGYYLHKSIHFFLFAPAQTLFNRHNCCAVAANAAIVYENGANVKTSFLTNLEEVAVRSAPALYQAIKAANAENQRKIHKEFPKYSYPPEVLSSVQCGYFSEQGIDFSVERGECTFIRGMDEQRKHKKAIFGGGYLLSGAAAARAAAARAAAARAAAAQSAAAQSAAIWEWKLSEREQAICAALDASHEGVSTK